MLGGGVDAQALERDESGHRRRVHDGAAGALLEHLRQRDLGAIGGPVAGRGAGDEPGLRQFGGAGDPAKEAAWGTRAATERTGGAPNEPLAERVGFFTDTSICIGCKACEVACKEWNRNPVEGYDVTGDSYDNTGALGANTWRHVAFVEQNNDRIEKAREEGKQLISLGMPTIGPKPGRRRGGHPRPGSRRRPGRQRPDHCTSARSLYQRRVRPA